MNMKILILSVAAALAVSACGRDEPTTAQPAARGATAAPAQPQAAPAQPQANTPTTPANVGTASAAEKREGANPTQQQVDPKQPEQRRDFKHPNEGAGPRQ